MAAEGPTAMMMCRRRTRWRQRHVDVATNDDEGYKGRKLPFLFNFYFKKTIMKNDEKENEQ